MIDVDMPRKRAEWAAMFPNSNARTLDSWVGMTDDPVQPDARRPIEYLFAPLKPEE